MLIDYVRNLTGKHRSDESNRHLGFTLAFVAGAINAGGFLAVHQYTSHMTGIVSAMADNFALKLYVPVLTGMVGLLSFLTGAICTALMVNYARRHRMHSEYALPLLLEAALLLCFGIVGARLAEISGLLAPATVMLLCFIMGLQNAVITKVSNSVIRTTHITGIVTDIGIELGRLIYWNASEAQEMGKKVVANMVRLRILTFLLMFFFVGGVTGALGFKYFGYIATIPLALILIVLSSIPALDDFTALIRRFR